MQTNEKRILLTKEWHMCAPPDFFLFGLYTLCMGCCYKALTEMPYTVGKGTRYQAATKEQKNKSGGAHICHSFLAISFAVVVFALLSFTISSNFKVYANTFTDPIWVVNATQLETIGDGTLNDADMVRSKTAYYRLRSNITINAGSWTPTCREGGTGANGAFIGTLDGRDHNSTRRTITITGNMTAATHNFGIVGYAAANAVFRDLNIVINSGVTIGGSFNNVGVLLGFAETGVRFENVTVEINGTVFGLNNVGGIVGGMTGNNNGTTPSFSGVQIDGNGTVSGTSSVGGIAGSINGNRTISNCTSQVNVTATGNSAGGMVGEFAVTSNLRAVFQSSATGQVTSTGSNVGGFMGSVTLGALTRIDTASATATLVRGANFVGGFIGLMQGGTIENAYTHSRVELASTATANAAAGGFVGGTSTTAVTLKNCYASGGSANTIASNSAASVVAGGLVGRNEDTITITSCATMVQTITATGTRGIMIGHAQGTATFTEGLTSLYDDVVNVTQVVGNAAAPPAGRVTGVLTAALKLEATYTNSQLGWPFSSATNASLWIWMMDTAGTGYPIFRHVGSAQITLRFFTLNISNVYEDTPYATYNVAPGTSLASLTATQLPAAPMRSGEAANFTFMGWYSAKFGAGDVQYASTASPRVVQQSLRDQIINGRAGAVIDIYAVWNYRITFQMLDGANTKPALVIRKGVSVTPTQWSASVPSISGWAFLNSWHTAADNPENRAENAAKNTDSKGYDHFGAMYTDGNITLHARMETEVRFNTQGGPVRSAVKRFFGAEYTPTDLPAIDGWGFSGWFDSQTNARQAHTSTLGAMNVVPADDIVGNRTLYARWLGTIAYDVAGEITTEVFTRYLNITLSPIINHHPRWQSDGWRADLTDSYSPKITSIATSDPYYTANPTVYAHLTSTVAYDYGTANGREIQKLPHWPNSVTIVNGASYVLFPPEPVLGNEFIRWRAIWTIGNGEYSEIVPRTGNWTFVHDNARPPDKLRAEWIDADLDFSGLLAAMEEARRIEPLGLLEDWHLYELAQGTLISATAQYEIDDTARLLVEQLHAILNTSIKSITNKTFDQYNYTEATFDPFSGKLEYAKNQFSSNLWTQTTIGNVQDMINTYMGQGFGGKGLKILHDELVSIRELRTQIGRAYELEGRDYEYDALKIHLAESDYTQGSWNEMVRVLQAALGILLTGDTQGTVDNFVPILKEAIDNLGAVKELRNMVNDILTDGAANYSEEVLKSLLEIIYEVTAEGVLFIGDAEIIDYYYNLLFLTSQLLLVDKAELANVIWQAKSIKKEDFTAESYQKLFDAIANAEEILQTPDLDEENNLNFTQQEINEAIQAIQEALGKLRFAGNQISTFTVVMIVLMFGAIAMLSIGGGAIVIGIRKRKSLT